MLKYDYQLHVLFIILSKEYCNKFVNTHGYSLECLASSFEVEHEVAQVIISIDQAIIIE